MSRIYLTHMGRGYRAIGLAILASALGAAATAAPAAPAPAAIASDAAKELAAEAAREKAVAEAIQAEVSVSGQDTAPATDQAKPAEKRKLPGKPTGDGQREMTLDEIRDLPILKRYDLPFEKGEALLADVKDNTFDYDESALWWLIDRVAKMPPELFKPDDMVTGYPQLLAMPSAYRGQPVTIRGAYMTVTPFQTPILALRKDVPVLYECNIRELPLTEERPVATVIVLEDPMDHLKVFDDVRIKGYFYKVRRYRGTKGEGFAPMLVARRLEKEETGAAGLGPTAPRGTAWMPVYAMGGLLLVVGAVFLWLRFVWTRPRTKANAHATSARPIHRIRLRRPDRPEPFADGGPPGQGDEPKP